MSVISHTRGRKVSSHRIQILGAVAAATVVGGAVPVFAVDRTYVGPASGASARWNAGGNWTGGVIPAAADNALISNADLINRTVLLDTNSTIVGLIVNQTGAGAINTLSQTSPTAFTLNTTTETIGSTGSGAYVQSSGTNTATTLFLGNAAAATGTYTLGGGTLDIATRNVGFNGHGTFVQSGGSNKGSTLTVGNNSGAVGSYSLSGGTLTGTTLTLAGAAGANATMTLSNNGSIKAADMMIANGGTATFTQTGGSLTMTDPNGVRLGEQGGSSGVASVTGGTWDTPNLHIGGNPFGAAGHGEMTIGGTANVDVAGTLHVYNTTPFSGFGDLTLAGGTLGVDVIDLHDGPNRFHWTGGTLNIRAGGTTTFGTAAAGTSTAGHLGAFQALGTTQHLITGSAAQVAALDLHSIELQGSATETVEVQLNGGSIDSFGTFIVRNSSTFRQSSGTLHSLLTGVSSETDTPSAIVQTGGTHTADVTPLATVVPAFRAMFIGLRGTNTSTYTLAGGALNAIGGIAMGADLDPVNQSTFVAGGTGILNISGGVATVTNGGILVLNTGRPNRINLSGGRLNTDSIDLQGDFSALNWTGGTFAYTGAGPFDIGSGGRIGMMLNMTPSKTLEVPNALRATAGGAIVLAGGHVKAASLDLAGDASRLQWSGGTLEITGAGGITIGSGATGPGTTMKIPAGANLDTTQLIVGPTGSLFVPGGNILARAEVNNGGDIRLGGAGARIDTSLPLTTNFLNFKLLRGDGQVDVKLQNQAAGEVRATGDETLRFTSFSNTNSGKINLINGGTIDFTIGLVNNSAGQITGRGTLMVGEDGLSNAGTISMTGGDSSVYADITQTATGRLITTGNSTVTYFGDVTGAAGSEIRTSSGSTAVFMGSAVGNHTGGGVKIFDGPGALGAPASAGVIASITGDTIVESDIIATRLREDELEVYGHLKIAANGTSAGTSRVNALTIANGGTLDLSNNKLIVAHGDIGTFAGGQYSGISGMIQRGYDFSAWDGDGLVTTRPDALAGLTTLAIASADETFYAGGTFGGVAAASGDALIMYTYAGDANLDGLVDAGDYGIIDNFFQFPGTTGYANGDFNYDGVIDAGDYGLIDNAFQLQGAPIPVNSAAMALSGVSAVPEPSSVCGFAILIAATSIARRRRR